MATSGSTSVTSVICSAHFAISPFANQKHSGGKCVMLGPGPLFPTAKDFVHNNSCMNELSGV